MTYRLTYWPRRGRAEQVRLLLSELGQDWEDVSVEAGTPGFRALRDQGPGVLPFGSVPVLEDDGFRLAQAPVILSYLARKHAMAPPDLRDQARADAIAWGAEDLRIEYFRLWGKDSDERQAAFVAGRWKDKWLPAFDGLLALNGDAGVFVGQSLTHADVAVWDALDAVVCWVAGARLDASVRLGRFYSTIRERPRIAAYLASDRRAQG